MIARLLTICDIVDQLAGCSKIQGENAVQSGFARAADSGGSADFLPDLPEGVLPKVTPEQVDTISTESWGVPKAHKATVDPAAIQGMNGEFGHTRLLWMSQRADP